MVKAGEILAIYDKEACRVFHNLEAVDLSERRVVYLNCNEHPGLLCDGEWESYFHSEIPTVTELPDGELRDRIIEQKTVPYRQYITLGYLKARIAALVAELPNKE
jgi:hypothetical protein